MPPNGLTAFFHVSADNRTKTAYLGFRPDWQLDRAFKIPKEMLDKLEFDGILKVVHRKGKSDPKIETVTYGDFAQEVREIVGHSDGQNPINVDDSLRHVHSLFNGCSGINSDFTRFPKCVLEEMPEIATPFGEYCVPVEAVLECGVSNDNDLSVNELGAGNQAVSSVQEAHPI